MTSTAFQLVDNQTFLPANVSNGVIFTSADQINGVGTDLSTGIRVIVDYHDLQSVPAGATLQTVVEGKSTGGQYYILAYQFELFSAVGFEQKRQIVMTPNMDWPDAGIDNIIFIGNSTVATVSNQVGTLPNIWRVKVFIQDPSPPRFVSVRMSIYGERFNELTFPDEFKNILIDTDGTLITDIT